MASENEFSCLSPLPLTRQMTGVVDDEEVIRAPAKKRTLSQCSTATTDGSSCATTVRLPSPVPFQLAQEQDLGSSCMEADNGNMLLYHIVADMLPIEMPEFDDFEETSIAFLQKEVGAQQLREKFERLLTALIIRRNRM